MQVIAYSARLPDREDWWTGLGLGLLLGAFLMWAWIWWEWGP